MQETAYAKINLALHVRRRREDGYHELETLFAFVDIGDKLSLQPANRFQLEIGGEFSKSLTLDDGNIVTRAVRALHGGELPGVRIGLSKMLPVAAGLGGGSADAAAVFRLFGAEDRLDIAATLGADVPACISSEPVIGLGTGTDLNPVVNDVRGLACVLVNPRIPMPTGPVFKAWDGTDRGAMPLGSAREIMLGGRNDLEQPAISLCAEIGHVLDYLHQTDALLVRMSGSGASCFALYDDFEQAAEIGFRLREFDHTEWWSWEGRLR